MTDNVIPLPQTFHRELATLMGRSVAHAATNPAAMGRIVEGLTHALALAVMQSSRTRAGCDARVAGVAADLTARASELASAAWPERADAAAQGETV